jgi:hypothetical protein
MFGRFNLDEARGLFDLASVSNRFAQVLRDLLCQSNYELVTLSELSVKGSIFSILRSSSNESVPLIRLLHFHLGGCNDDDRHQLLIWQEVPRFSFEYLIDLSLAESHALRSLITD